MILLVVFVTGSSRHTRTSKLLSRVEKQRLSTASYQMKHSAHGHLVSLSTSTTEML